VYPTGHCLPRRILGQHATLSFREIDRPSLRPILPYVFIPSFSQYIVANLVPVLVLINHYVWFRHFSNLQTRAYQRSSYYERPDVPTFTMIASYFGLCVWLVPFALFVSLSAGDNVLPTMGTEPARGLDGKNKPQGMIKAIVSQISSAIGQIAGSSGMDRP
jgi:hypothetical protein